MKKLIFGLIATVLFGNLSFGQEIKDFLVKSEVKFSKDSKDNYYENFVEKVDLPKGILINGDDFKLYTLNNENYKMIEVPVLSEKKIVNFMFVILDVKKNSSWVIFKNHQNGVYEFYDAELEKIYTLNFTEKEVEFTNQTSTTEKKSCYTLCRERAYAIVEGDALTDFACSINPCGAAIAVYCGIQCW